MVFNQSQIFNWEGYGVKLHIPQGMLPGSLKECKLLIKVGLSGKFEFPQKTSLVSAVYLIDSEPRCKFSQPLTLEMQHCVQSSQTSRLNFARCSRNSPPYTFEILEGGEFSSQSAYGRIQLQSFSLIALLLTMLPWWARIFGDENVKYRARLYYLMKRVDRREIHFLITKDLDTYATVRCFYLIPCSLFIVYSSYAYYHRKFNRSTEVLPLDQTCQLSLTPEITSH